MQLGEMLWGGEETTRPYSIEKSPYLYNTIKENFLLLVQCVGCYVGFLLSLDNQLVEQVVLWDDQKSLKVLIITSNNFESCF